MRQAAVRKGAFCAAAFFFPAGGGGECSRPQGHFPPAFRFGARTPGFNCIRSVKKLCSGFTNCFPIPTDFTFPPCYDKHADRNKPKNQLPHTPFLFKALPSEKSRLRKRRRDFLFILEMPLSLCAGRASDAAGKSCAGRVFRRKRRAAAPSKAKGLCAAQKSGFLKAFYRSSDRTP